jgi:ribonuclease/clavin/mitogillin
MPGSNTYLIGRGSSRILLDTGQGFPAWKENLSSALKAQSATVSTCLLSHWHHDHIGGLADFLELCPEAKVYKNRPSLDPDGILKVDNVLDIEDGQTFSIGEGNDRFAIKALHCPGHTADHMAFTVTESSGGEEGAMFTGDNVLGHGTAVFENLAAYLNSLHLMSDSIGSGARAYPAHGAVLENGKATIDMYIKHRQQREEEALRVLRTGRVDEVNKEKPGVEIRAREWGSMEMVKIIYKDVPENLHGPAEGGLLQVLRKLEGEGKVEKSDSGKWQLGKKPVL